MVSYKIKGWDDMIYTKEMIKKQNEKILKRRKIKKIILLPIFCLVIVMAGFIGYQKLIKHDNNVSFLGLRQYVVMTGSMSPEYEIGDLIVVRKASAPSIQLGDVITYSAGQESTVTHRVVDIVQKNGQVYYQTKGDSNNTPDTELVPYTSVQGKVFFNIHQAGKLITTFITGCGSILIFILVIFSYSKTVREEERMIAREDARKKYNTCKYKKETVTHDIV